MGGILTGFAILLVLVTIGYLAARRGTLPPGSQEVLAKVAFTYASPALLFSTLLDAPVETVLSLLLVGVALSSALVALVFVVVATLWRRRAGELVIGALASSYVNGANLGIPIAFYVLGDASYVAPVLLFQLVLAAPVALAVLDVVADRADRADRADVGRRGDAGARTGRAAPGHPDHRARLSRWTRPLRNPLIVASVLGLAANLLDLDLPDWVTEPVSLLAGAAVPLTLLVFGISLRGMRLGVADFSRDVLLATTLKVAVHPAVAFGVGGLLGLSGRELLALTVIAALPAAQNIYVYAVTYDESRSLARSTVLLTTVLALPAIVVVSVLLG
ncbi:AEC family transporter [Georgenia muralis]